MLVTEFGGPLQLGDLEPTDPGPGQVKIAVNRAGVNFPDMLIIRGQYQARPDLPFAPGFEVAGTVIGTGADVERFAQGDRVMAYLLFGGYAEEVVADEGSVFALPDAVTDDQAAVTPIAYGTSYHALIDRAALRSEETLVVLGASGGVGLTAVEIGKLLGAHVIGLVGSDWKAKIVQEQGADEVVNYETEDVRGRILEITDGRGADVIYDPVGGDAADAALRYLAWRGRLLVVGFTSGRITEIPTNHLLLKGASAVGVFWGSFAEREPAANLAAFESILGWIDEGTLVPQVTKSLPLEDAALALEALERREAVGKTVLEVR
jgi:NADPH2:quinone reductase